MPNWYGAFTPGEGLKRTFSLVNLMVAAVVLSLGAAELRFDWIEKLAGQYLASTNDGRPETGGMWESGRHAVNAHQSLNRIIHQKQEALKTARESETFADLAGELGPGKWVNLDKRQFKALYDGLRGAVSQSLLDPVRLLWLLNTEAVDRIFCEGRLGGLKVYFIDKDNRVVHQLDLDTAALLEGPDRNLVRGSLDQVAEFSGSIYRAGDFFNAVFRLPGDMVEGLVPDAQVLLDQEGTLSRVGIGNRAEKGYIRLGFEYVRLGEPVVIQVQAREWAVWQLNQVLRGESR